MATYSQLQALRGSASLQPLRDQVLIALAIKANTLSKATPTAAQKAFASAALSNPSIYLDTIISYLLAEYNGQATTAITGATDAQVQTAVNAAVDTILIGA